MEKDKSSTHVRVIKNGIEDWMPKTVWAAIGENDNKDGWILVHDGSSLPEVVEIRSKKSEKHVEVETKVEEVSEPVLAGESEEPIAVKRKYTKRK